MPKVEMSLFDTCSCGDYRLDHHDGTGHCEMPDNIVHGYRPCRQFRLSTKADVFPEWIKDGVGLASRGSLQRVKAGTTECFVYVGRCPYCQARRAAVIEDQSGAVDAAVGRMFRDGYAVTREPCPADIGPHRPDCRKVGTGGH